MNAQEAGKVCYKCGVGSGLCLGLVVVFQQRSDEIECPVSELFPGRAIRSVNVQRPAVSMDFVNAGWTMLVKLF